MPIPLDSYASHALEILALNACGDGSRYPVHAQVARAHSSSSGSNQMSAHKVSMNLTRCAGIESCHDTGASSRSSVHTPAARTEMRNNASRTLYESEHVLPRNAFLSL